MTKVGRAVEKGETQGFMKIIVDAQTREILGAAILGTGGDEAIHSILDVMYAKAPYTVIQRAMHIHPTVSELIPTMLGELRPLPRALRASAQKNAASQASPSYGTPGRYHRTGTLADWQSSGPRHRGGQAQRAHRRDGSLSGR